MVKAKRVCEAEASTSCYHSVREGKNIDLGETWSVRGVVLEREYMSRGD